MFAVLERQIVDVAKERSDQKNQGEANFDALTSLRFFAAVSVFFAHAHTSGLLNLVSTKRELHAFSETVCFFFVLSGFVLAYRYQSMSSRRDVLQYFGNRVARIAPLYYLTGLACLVIASMVYSFTPSYVSLSAYAFALQDWFTTSEVGWAINPPAHSVSSETFFYLVFPLFLLFGRSKLSLISGAVVVAVTLIYNCFGLSANPKSMQPVLGLAFFAAGAASFDLYRRFASSIRQFASAALWTRVAFTFAEITALFCCFAVSLRPINQDYWLMGRIFSSGPVFEFATLVAFAACTFVFALECGAISRFLKLKPIVALGHASYALFLAHYGIIVLFSFFFKQQVPLHLQTLLGWPCLAVSIVVALMLSWHVEEPCRKYITELTFNLLNQKLPALRPSVSYSTIAKGLAVHLLVPVIGLLAIVPGGQFLSQLSVSSKNRAEYEEWKMLKQPALSGSSKIGFGDSAELLGAKIVHQNEKTFLKTAWRLRADVKQDVGFLATHLLDSRRQIVKNLDHQLAPGLSSASIGHTWLDVVEIPPLANAQECGLALYDPKTKTCSVVSGGTTDWDGRRLIVSLSESK